MIISFSFAKKSSSVPIYTVIKDENKQEVIKIQINKVFTQLRNINLVAQQRQKIKTANGVWYCHKDKNQFTYIILTNSNYPERHAYGAIRKLQQHIQKLNNQILQSQNNLKVQCKEKMKQIVELHNDLKSIDKIYQVGNTVETLKQQMMENYKRLADNKNQLDQLQLKSSLMKDAGQQFSNNSSQLERIMYWRNLKLKIIIVIIIIAILIFVIVPIIMKLKNK